MRLEWGSDPVRYWIAWVGAVILVFVQVDELEGELRKMLARSYASCVLVKTSMKRVKVLMDHEEW